MNRQRALELLSRSKPELQARFGVTRLALFGSTARDTAISGSDVDVLVAFDGPATSKEPIGESATQFPDEIRATRPKIPWRMIIATRNRLTHGDLGIDDDTLWSSIRDDVPQLLPLLQTLQNQAQP
ncbi:MAG: hypothetical protein B7Z66_12690 [Chromatiales bacterium 21-64-14]|nr:MAG: hypothetical protein B7Z66_12690 [Chromatiales bacterium 21-64-14]HQU17178.1 DUF86 domain-containing protein [Gammaproteobacteria bacterium]